MGSPDIYVVLLRELCERGYEGGYSILKEYLHPLRWAARQVAVRRFETAPGIQAQVDSLAALERQKPTMGSRSAAPSLSLRVVRFTLLNRRYPKPRISTRDV